MTLEEQLKALRPLWRHTGKTAEEVLRYLGQGHVTVVPHGEGPHALVFVTREFLHESNSPVGEWWARPVLKRGEDWVFSVPVELNGKVRHFVCQETREIS
jgi:hypothetical protein